MGLSWKIMQLKNRTVKSSNRPKLQTKLFQFLAFFRLDPIILA